MIIPKQQFDAIFDPCEVAYIGSSPLLNAWFNPKSKTGRTPGKQKDVVVVSQPVAHLLHKLAEQEGIPETNIIETVIRMYAASKGYVEETCGN